MRFLYEGIFPQRPKEEEAAVAAAASEYDMQIIIESFDESRILTPFWLGIAVMLEYRLIYIILVIAAAVCSVINPITRSGFPARLSTRFQGGYK